MPRRFIWLIVALALIATTTAVSNSFASQTTTEEWEEVRDWVEEVRDALGDCTTQADYEARALELSGAESWSAYISEDDPTFTMSGTIECP